MDLVPGKALGNSLAPQKTGEKEGQERRAETESRPFLQSHTWQVAQAGAKAQSLVLNQGSIQHTTLDHTLPAMLVLGPL